MKTLLFSDNICLYDNNDMSCMIRWVRNKWFLLPFDSTPHRWWSSFAISAHISSKLHHAILTFLVSALYALHLHLEIPLGPELKPRSIEYRTCWLELASQALLSQHLFVGCFGRAEILDQGGVLLDLYFWMCLQHLEESNLMHVCGYMERAIPLVSWFCSW